ncbi:MAG: Hsp20/alpha crystallin family protein [Minisyncoccales bacterium]
MDSFLEKLKKGMNIEGASLSENNKEKEKTKKPLSEKKAKIEVKKLSIIEPGEKSSVEKKRWSFEEEGQLTIDLYQTENELVLQSAVAGVRPEDLDISIENEILLIRGYRKKPIEEKGDYFTQECFWGPFAREIVLPVEIDPGRTQASFKDGILTIIMPKIEKEKKRKIIIKD